MVVGDFRDLVYQMVSKEGVPYIDAGQTATLNQLISDGAQDYSARTRCLGAPGGTLWNPFTPIVGIQTYYVYNNQTGDATNLDLNGSPVKVLQQPMCYVSQCFLDGFPLAIAGDYLQRQGASTENAVSRLFPNYLYRTNGLPVYFFPLPQGRIVFDRPFDQVYGDCSLTGADYHSPINGSNTNQPMEFLPEDLRPAARFCRNMLLEVLNPEKAAQLLPMVEAEVADRLAQSISQNAMLGKGIALPMPVTK